MKRDGDELFDHYRHVLEKLGTEKGLLGLIFNKSQNKFQDPAKLRRLIDDLEQTAQLSSAHQNPPEAERLGGNCRTGQRSLLRRSRRDRPPEVLHECEIHSLLRLPTGLFYAEGVKAKRSFLRQEAGQRNPVDQEALDL
jgi:hypothetical protein